MSVGSPERISSSCRDQISSGSRALSFCRTSGRLRGRSEPAKNGGAKIAGVQVIGVRFQREFQMLEERARIPDAGNLFQPGDSTRQTAMHNSKSPCRTPHMLLPIAPGTAAQARDSNMRRPRPDSDFASLAAAMARPESAFRLQRIAHVSTSADPRPYCTCCPADRVLELLPSTAPGTAWHVCIAPDADL